MEVTKEEVQGALMMLHQLMLWYWKNKVHQDLFKWFEEQTWDNPEDKQQVLDADQVSIKYTMKHHGGTGMVALVYSFGDAPLTFLKKPVLDCRQDLYWTLRHQKTDRDRTLIQKGKAWRKQRSRR
jgi:hypothetical protein